MILALLLLIVSTTTVLSIAAVVRFTQRARRASLPAVASDPPPVTILKPLCGADDALERNLETFFRQTYPRFELVFGVEGATDPAIAVVRRLRARYPMVATRLVVHDGKRALNPKVSNLVATLEREPRGRDAHDLVVISDSNVAVRPEWLGAMVAEFQADRGLGLLTNLFVGTGEETLGATMENLHLAGPVAGSVAVTHEFSDDCIAIGKSMMFRRSVFDALGGFDSIGSVLAEDYVMGRMFAAAGYGVRLAPITVDNVVQSTTVRRFLQRNVRWSLIRSRVTPLVYPLEPLANPMLLTVVGVIDGLGGASAGAAIALTGLGLTLARDAIQWLRLRGPRGLAQALPLGPIKDLLMLGVWAVSPFLGRVAWRGKSFRVAAGTRLYAERPMGLPERREVD